MEVKKNSEDLINTFKNDEEFRNFSANISKHGSESKLVCFQCLPILPLGTEKVLSIKHFSLKIPTFSPNYSLYLSSMRSRKGFYTETKVLSVAFSLALLPLWS